MAQQQLSVGANTQLTGAHNQTREALAVRSLISECVQLMKLLRALCQYRASPTLHNLEQHSKRDVEAQMITAIRQVHTHHTYCLLYRLSKANDRRMIKSADFVGPLYRTTKNRPTFVCHTTDFIGQYFGDKFSSRACSNFAEKIGR